MEPSEKDEFTKILENRAVTPISNEGENYFDEGEFIKVTRTYSPPLLRPSSTIETSRRISEQLTTDAFGAVSNSPPPVEFNDNSSVNGFNMGSGKAYYYSQLSIMLFEKAVEDNPSFPEDLDRVHSWFTKELSEVQKLVCLHELLSLISPSQHRFLFTSVAFDTNQSSVEEEAVWLDLAMSEAQKQTRTTETKTINKLEDRLMSLDLKPGESLFSGLKIPKSKFPTEKTTDPATNDSNSSNSSSLKSSQSQSQFPPLCPSPLSASDSTSKFSAILKMPKEEDEQEREELTGKDGLPLAPGKAPPGFLSPTALEFRPSEPSCYPEVYMSDFSKWLRLLRLHKYDPALTPVYEKDKIGLLRVDEGQLEVVGVSAMGARKKLLRLFTRVSTELSI